MAKHTPKTVDPSEVAELGRATIKDAKFPQLATIDGDQPRVRPISPLRNYLGSVDNPERLACKVVPKRVSYMQEWALEYHDVPLQLD